MSTKETLIQWMFLQTEWFLLRSPAGSPWIPRIFQPSISWHLHRDPVVFAHSSLFISHHSLGAEVNHFCVSLAQPPWYSVARNSEILVLCACSILTSKERGMNIKLHQHQKQHGCLLVTVYSCLCVIIFKKHISFLIDLIPPREKRKLLY